MSPRKAHFVTGCQQLLALGVVLAVLIPATGVVSLDVVVEAPPVAARQSVVETRPVEPRVVEYALTPPDGGAGEGGSAQLGPSAGEGGSEPGRGDPGAPGQEPSEPRGSRIRAGEVVGAPEPVAGYGAVGVTWSAESEPVGEDRITLQVRTRSGEDWSGWTELEYDDDHAPDPGSPEAAGARPGTDPLLVGQVDEVQARARVRSGAVPDDMRMAVVDPGESTAPEAGAPAIDTAAMDTAAMDTAAIDTGSSPEGPAATLSAAAGRPAADGAPEALTLRAGTFTAKPRIFSRAQWGADERMRDPGSLRYFEVHAGFVHHTVNANGYTRAQVPSIIRGIYAYHTRSRGWSDIGYNFLVDRFGRIWEGRYGGVTRPVVGAHTLGYNDYAFAMSAIGNFETVRPSRAVLAAYGRLMAWKLSLHGVDAASGSQRVGNRTFRAINGHRDAAATACPGRYLYARLGAIRARAAAAQADWSGRERDMDLVSSRHPDLLLRRASDARLFVLPTGGMTRFLRPVGVGEGFGQVTALVGSPDVSGDGRPDLIVRSARGITRVRAGTAAGTFAVGVRPTRVLRGFDLVTAAGDLDGDRHNDLVARWPRSGRLFVFRGDGRGGFTRVRGGIAFAGYDALAATGDLTGDGRPDLAARTRSGRLYVHPGNGRGGFRSPIRSSGRWGGFDVITGYGDMTGDGRGDLVVRAAANGFGYVVPSRGDGTFAPRRGPFRALRGLGGVTGIGRFAGNRAPDLVGRRGDQLVVIRNSGGVETRRPVRTNLRLVRATAVLNVGDWDRDGSGDLVVRARSGRLLLRRGDGRGAFAQPVAIGSGFGSVGLLAAVGDMTGDGWPDLMGQPARGPMRIYPGRGTAGLAPGYAAYRRVSADRQMGVGRWNGDGAPDSLFRSGRTLVLHPGNGPGGLMRGHRIALDLSGYDRLVGIADIGVNGHPDLVLRSRAGHLWLVSASATRLAPRRLLAEALPGYDLVG